jgi:hypothetical protein
MRVHEGISSPAGQISLSTPEVIRRHVREFQIPIASRKAAPGKERAVDGRE